MANAANARPKRPESPGVRRAALTLTLRTRNVRPPPCGPGQRPGPCRLAAARFSAVWPQGYRYGYCRINLAIELTDRVRRESRRVREGDKVKDPLATRRARL